MTRAVAIVDVVVEVLLVVLLAFALLAFGAVEPWSELGVFGVGAGIAGLLVVRAPNESGYQLQEGDVLMGIDGRVPESPGHAFRILRSYQPGEKLKLDVLRSRKRMEVSVTVPRDRPMRRRARRCVLGPGRCRASPDPHRCARARRGSSSRSRRRTRWRLPRSSRRDRHRGTS